MNEVSTFSLWTHRWNGNRSGNVPRTLPAPTSKLRALRRQFSWAQARGLLDGLPGGGLNIAHEAVDRHVLAGRGGKLALRWIGRDDAVRDFSYAQLGAESKNSPTCWHSVESPEATACSRCSAAVRSSIWRRSVR